MLFEVGDIVSATAGRDEGKYFVVMEIVDGIYVHITDGRTRRLEKPKKKKCKHLNLVKKVGNEFTVMINQKKVTNMHIRKHLENRLFEI